MLTSPRQYACKLSYKLIEKGAKPVWVPGVQITNLCDPHRQQAWLRAHHFKGRSDTCSRFTTNVLQVTSSLALGQSSMLTRPMCRSV